MMFPEAFAMSSMQLVEELQSMGVKQILISHAEADVRLLAGLYIYCLVEAHNA